MMRSGYPARLLCVCIDTRSDTGVAAWGGSRAVALTQAEFRLNSGGAGSLPRSHGHVISESRHACMSC